MKNPHWIEREHLFDGKEYICSRCGASFEEPWEECPACGVKMKKIKYGPGYDDEAEGQKRAGRITGLPFCEKGCAQLRCFSCEMKLFMAEFCVRIESRSGLRE